MDDAQRRRHYQCGANLLARYFPLDKSKNKAAITTKTIGKHSVEEDNFSTHTIVPTYTFSENSESSEEEQEESCAESKESSLVPSLNTNRVSINPVLQRALRSLDLNSPNTVQLKVLGWFSNLKRSNEKGVEINAPPKSGKTTAVIIGVINEFLRSKCEKRTQCLILCPTKELAEKCYSFAQQLTKLTFLQLCLAVKGKDFCKKKITDSLIIATPDKIIGMDFCLDFKNFRFVFFDDVDSLNNPKNMFKIFDQIHEKLSSKCRIIISKASETETESLREFKDKFLPYHVQISVENKTLKNFIKQYFVIYDNFCEKVEALVHLLISKTYLGQTIIFCETKNTVDELEILLKERNIPAVKLVGGKKGLPITLRSDILENFKNNEIMVLITTRAFATIVSNKYVTKIVNSEIILNENHKLDHDEYQRRESLLCGKQNALAIRFVSSYYERNICKNEEKQFDFIDKITVEKFLKHF